MKTYSIITLGCKVNQYESSSIAASFDAMGFEYKKFPDICDIYVVNTCTVTNMSDRKSRQMMHKARSLNPDCVIIATGCLVQNKPEDMKANGADIILGNNEKPYIEDIVNNYLNNKEDSLISVSDISRYKPYTNTRFADRWERTRGYLKIQDGCDNFCSYCIIPYVRGRVRSRELTDIIKEAEFMASNGIKEVVLTGIHLNSYGKDLNEISLLDVISALNDVKGIRRIRLGSLEPNVVDEEFINEILKYPKLCPHFHMSLQSGSDNVLKDMNRRYDSRIYLKAVKLLRDNLPDVELTTDIIVGYPTETEEDFLMSINLVTKAEFLKTHVFKFSRRKGTKAEKLKPLNSMILNERSDRLISVADKTAYLKMSSYIGKTLEILVEEQKQGYVIGHSRNYIKVQAHLKKETNTSYINNFYKVLITKADKNNLYGNLVE